MPHDYWFLFGAYIACSAIYRFQNLIVRPRLLVELCVGAVHTRYVHAEFFSL